VKENKRLLVIFGTRPEAIKMCPLVKELKSTECFEVEVCLTGQHEGMLSGLLPHFGVEAKYNLHIMKAGQTLKEITERVMDGVHQILEKSKPDLVLVHGDTTSAFASALACFYMKIPVCHVEAGLRTYNTESPYPEEFNRQAIGIIAKYHFAPTEKAKSNLIAEGKDPASVFVTGNTGIDALKSTVKEKYESPLLSEISGKRLILITAHRRENLGEPMRNMFRAIKRVVKENPDVIAIYPVHLNPEVRKIANEILLREERIKIIPPLDVLDFHNLMARSHLILTDSGGIQEEAPALGKPVLVMRDTTERPEGVAAGTLKLVGTTEQGIYEEFSRLLCDKAEYSKMAKAKNPYGDGKASERIVKILGRTVFGAEKK